MVAPMDDNWSQTSRLCRLGTLPEWESTLEFSERALDRFIYSYEPAGELAEEFRDDLAAVIAEAVAAERETIARQAMRLEALEVENARLRENIKNAILHIVSIGGPLNDNKLGYSKPQMVTFWRIKEELEA